MVGGMCNYIYKYRARLVFRETLFRRIVFKGKLVLVGGGGYMRYVIKV